MLRKGFLDKQYLEFTRMARFTDAIVDTQEEVYGKSMVDDCYWEGYLRFLDIVKGRVDKKRQPYFIFSASKKIDPICPECLRKIAGIDSLLEFCEDQNLASRIRVSFENQNLVPTQCPSGHFLFYSFRTNSFEKRNRSEVDDYLELAKNKGYLPSIWG